MGFRKWSVSALRAYVEDVSRLQARQESASQGLTLLEETSTPDMAIAGSLESDAKDSGNAEARQPSVVKKRIASSASPIVEEAKTVSETVRLLGKGPDSHGPQFHSHYEVGPPLPSEESERERDWHIVKSCFDSGEPLTGLVTGWNRGGLLIRWRSLQGFIPTSQLRNIPRAKDPEAREAELARYVGEELTLRIIELDRSRNRLVLSERAMDWEAHEGEALLASLKPGEVRRGRVSNLCDFGAFVDLGGVDGLVHVSEIAWRRIAHPQDVLEIGQEVDVYVINVDRERRRIALSLKRAHSNPWATVDQRYHVGQIVEGVITNVVSFGAFARIEEGVEGLIHISELAEGDLIHPSSVVREGDVVKLRILRIDSQNHRLGLSLRQASEVHEHWSPASSDELGVTLSSDA